MDSLRYKNSYNANRFLKPDVSTRPSIYPHISSMQQLITLESNFRGVVLHHIQTAVARLIHADVKIIFSIVPSTAVFVPLPLFSLCRVPTRWHKGEYLQQVAQRESTNTPKIVWGARDSRSCCVFIKWDGVETLVLIKVINRARLRRLKRVLKRNTDVSDFLQSPN